MLGRALYSQEETLPVVEVGNYNLSFQVVLLSC